MIRANHTSWAERIFQPYVRWLFKRHFHGLRILGKPPETNASLPLLLLPNHSTWWDGFFIHLLNKKLFGRKAHLMMLEEQLAKYRFFSRLGAFSIEPRSVSSTRQSLRCAAQIIKQPSSLLCIFPQGELLPWDKRPLGYKRGLEAILRTYGGEVNVLPLAIKNVFLQEQLPEAFFLFGANMIVDSNTFIGVRRLEAIEEALLDQISTKIAGGEKGVSLLSGRKSINVAIDGMTRFAF